MVSSPPSPPPPEIKKKKSVLPIAVGSLFLLALILVPFIEFDELGNPRLSQKREDKLKKELDDLDEAEQYVLTASLPGYYPCFSCMESGVDSAQVYLLKGEVWKYGKTTKGEKGRYRNSLSALNLDYTTQFRGTLPECLKQEKIKIYGYPLLPECLKRNFHLIRPPGNKQDN